MNDKKRYSDEYVQRLEEELKENKNIIKELRTKLESKDKMVKVMEKMEKHLYKRESFLEGNCGYFSKNRPTFFHYILLSKKFNKQLLLLETMAFFMDAETNRITFKNKDMTKLVDVSNPSLRKSIKFLEDNKFIRKVASEPYTYEVNSQYATNGYRKHFIENRNKVFNEILPLELTYEDSSGIIKKYNVVDFTNTEMLNGK